MNLQTKYLQKNRQTRTAINDGHHTNINLWGNLGLTTNYVGISLSVVAAKIVNKMLLNRILFVIDPLLRPNQNGSRPRRSTSAHILGLRRIIGEVKKSNLKAILAFVDFKQAFGSIHRGKLIKILESYGIPE